MARIVALLSGVNIGKRRLQMATLRAGLEDAGCVDVATYVQSGNVVLTPPKAVGRDVAKWLADEIGRIAGFDVAVVVRTANEMTEVIAANPYPESGGTRLHVVFCSTTPGARLLDAIDLDAVAPEQVAVIGSEVYLHLPDGMARATLPALLERTSKASGVVGTTRNWNTVQKLAVLAGPAPGG